MKRFLIALIVLSIALMSVSMVGAQERPDREQNGPGFQGEFGNGEGRPEFGGNRDRRDNRNGALRGIFEEAGLDGEAIREARQNGATLAEILADTGADVDEITAQLIAEAEAHLQEAYENGDLDEEELAERLAGVEDRIDDLLNGDPQERPARGGDNAPEGDDV